MFTRINGESGGWKCSSSQGRTREFFSWISFRAVRKSGIGLGQAQYLNSPAEGQRLQYLQANQDYKDSLQKTHWHSRTSCRKFWWFDNSNHKVLSEGCESRNNHRYAVVVQDLASQWIQSYPCDLSGNREELTKVFGADVETKSHLHWQVLRNSAKLVKIFHGVTVRQHLNVQKQMGLVRERYAGLRKGTSAVLLQSGLDEKWWTDSMEYCCHLPDWKTHYRRRFGEPCEGPIIPYGSMIEYHPISPKDL